MISDRTDDWTISYNERMPLEKYVSTQVVAVLSLMHPGKRGTTHMADPVALKKYGPDLYEKLHNIINEVQWSMKSARIQIKWTKGKPDILQVERLLILSN